MNFISEKQALEERIDFQTPPDTIEAECDAKGIVATWERLGGGFYQHHDKIWAMYGCRNQDCKEKEGCYGTSKLYLLDETGKVMTPEQMLKDDDPQDYTNT